MKYTSEIIGHQYVRLLKDGNLMYTHEAAAELNRLHDALEQIKALPSHRQDEANQIAARALESQ